MYSNFARLLALLKESEEIKTHKPKYNKALKNEIFKFGLELCNDSNDFKFLRISHFQENIDFIETYSSLKNANNRLSSIYDKFEISDKKSLINNFAKSILNLVLPTAVGPDIVINVLFNVKFQY